MAENKKEKKSQLVTASGHKLTVKESKFIDLYLQTGNGRKSIVEAGYTTKAPGQMSIAVLEKDYIRAEIEYRMKELHSERVASSLEILEYLTKVMRGEIKDQFNLDAPLGERTKAAQELARRTIDIENKIAGKAEAEVKIVLDWKRDEQS